VFYYWKRRYKYIMSRWGYSVNIATIEPFNETDQLLSYKNLAPGGLGTNVPIDTCNGVLQNEQGIPFRGLCRENRGPWQRDSLLPGIVDQWLTDLIGYVRGDVDTADVVGSPLGEKEKLFIMSYTDYMPASSIDLFTGVYLPDHYKPFTNPQVDMIDVHRGMNAYQPDSDLPDQLISSAFDHASSFRSAYPYPNPSLGDRKPFNQGEFNYYSHVSFGDWEREIEKAFHNYDVSFHNEIWASAFSGKFAAGTTWHWERVFWWPDALPPPPHPNNQYQLTPPSNTLGATNLIDIGIGTGFPITNRTLHHHFKPLADLLAHSSWLEYDFFNGEYTANKVFDNTNANELESYYLKDTTNTLAIGWVHNRNAWVMNNFYLVDSAQNFLGCDQPDSSTVTLTGFAPNTPFFITWFPTRMDTTIYPPATIDTSSATGTLKLDITGYVGGITNNYLDTLRSDYAFIITPEFFARSTPYSPVAEESPVPSGWDFDMYPNPTRDALFLRMHDDIPKEIVILDVTGRRVVTRANVASTIYQIPVGQLAQGAYWVRVRDGADAKTKKLIIH